MKNLTGPSSHRPRNRSPTGDDGHCSAGKADRKVWVGIRPEGFVLKADGAFTCDLDRIEVMGRDVSVISTHPASLKEEVRSIINADLSVDISGETIRYSIKPHKIFLFGKDDEERIRFEVK